MTQGAVVPLAFARFSYTWTQGHLSLSLRQDQLRAHSPEHPQQI